MAKQKLSNIIILVLFSAFFITGQVLSQEKPSQTEPDKKAQLQEEWEDTEFSIMNKEKETSKEMPPDPLGKEPKTQDSKDQTHSGSQAQTAEVKEPTSPAQTMKKQTPVTNFRPRTPAQTMRPRTPAQTMRPRTPAQTMRPRTPAQTMRPRTPAQTMRPRTPAQTMRPRTPAQTMRPRTPAQTMRPSSPQEQNRPRNMMP
jgi:hypothetical protein